MEINWFVLVILSSEFIAFECVDIIKLHKRDIHKWERILFVSSFTLEWYDFS